MVGILVSVLLLITLRVLAYAEPPDPPWISGFWDDDDHGDVAIRITSTSGIVNADPFVEAKPIRVFIASLPTDNYQPVPTGASPLRHPRAPPAS
jgi:hypothetical protein